MRASKFPAILADNTGLNIPGSEQPKRVLKLAKKHLLKIYDFPVLIQQTRAFQKARTDDFIPIFLSK
ncbi:MAG TPA: hypothetical protein DHU63_03105 [Candidatus Marinimicrobia bacterium]|nr:MAG: hypothetical protein COY19_11860 [Candidatus Marinimicrobia bacterium CG_4_10_14_0_2_um_filter_48_9]PJA54201.1 MAG: hypothetical protein CO167_05150 [Candidatus Marinimicrobia bacterium CG_4_9_14_3_um_filter_48_9]HCW75508.1 hypothetical protein [Candidatus Neomarinimicrobiota bacterium]